MSRSEKRNRNRINRNRHAAEVIGGHFRISNNGVPHTIVDIGNGLQASVCFFGRSLIWRVFFPYRQPNEKQVKTDHREMLQVVERLNQLRNEVACGMHS